MAAASITRAPTGELLVPDVPIVPVLPGDGVGPETWAAARAILDAAVTRAYGSRRKISWLELPSGRSALIKAGDALPAETLETLLQHPVHVCGPHLDDELAGSPPLRIRRALALFAAEAPVRTLGGPAREKLDVRVWWDALEHAANPVPFAPGMPQASAFLRLLRDRANDAFLRIRFGSRERVDSYLRAAGRREAPLVEVALSLEPVSWAGVHRLAVVTIRKARELKRKRVTFVHRTATSPQTEGAFRDWAMRCAEEDFGDDAFTSNALLRIAMRQDEETAERARDEAVREGAIYVEEATFDEALETVLGQPASLDTIVATADTAASLVRLLALRAGGTAIVPVVTSNPGQGRASFGVLGGPNVGDTGQDRASALAFVLAGELLLRHLGWKEAGDLALGAVEKALAQGRVPPDLAAFAPGASVVTARQFADAVAAAL